MTIDTISNGDTIVLEDGRKVIILGYLNSKELIAQEIFIIDGKEIPHGENFTIPTPTRIVPPISWKEKKVQELENRISTLEKEYEFKRDKYRKLQDELEESHRIQNDTLQKVFEYNFKLLKKLNPNIFTTLINYLTGKIEWIVIGDYSLKVMSWEDFFKEKTYEDQRKQKLKLLSLYGDDSGDMSFRLNRYSDGSGSDYHTMYFCNSKEDVRVLLQKLMEERELRYDDIKLYNDWDVEINPIKLEQYKSSKVAMLEKTEKKSREDHQRSLEHLNKFKSEFSII